MTRAVAALLAGRIREAARQNPLVFVLLPATLWRAAPEVYSAMRWNSWGGRPRPRAIS